MENKYVLSTNRYGNVTVCPQDWTVTTLTVAQLKKLSIPYYKYCSGFEKSGGYCRPILKNIIPVEFEERCNEYEQQLRIKKEAKRQKLEEKELTPKVVAECLYSINKEAKRQRDIKQSHYDSQRERYLDDDDYYDDEYSYRESKRQCYRHIQKAKEREQDLYDLKDRALSILIRENNLVPVGFHEFSDGRRMDYYVIEGYGFHMRENVSDNHLGDIRDEISSTRERSIPPIKAEKLLERYVTEREVIIR